jgi:hypothetical protein
MEFIVFTQADEWNGEKIPVAIEEKQKKIPLRSTSRA